MSETEGEWRYGRLVNPSITPNLCVHLVGLTPGLWCGACNTHPEHPDRHIPAPAPAGDSGGERCANYKPPVTCLTAPSSEAGRCDFCRVEAADFARSPR